MAWGACLWPLMSSPNKQYSKVRSLAPRTSVYKFPNFVTLIWWLDLPNTAAELLHIHHSLFLATCSDIRGGRGDIAGLSCLEIVDKYSISSSPAACQESGAVQFRVPEGSVAMQTMSVIVPAVKEPHYPFKPLPP